MLPEHHRGAGDGGELEVGVGPMEAQGIILAALGYLGQHLKAIKDFPTWAAQLVVAVSAVAAFTLLQLPQAGHVREWVVQAIGFALSTLGAASVAGATGLAPKTDSK
jgi:hypothetical protein